MEKVYKNVNMIRTFHPVQRIVRFKDLATAMIFVSSYKEVFVDGLDDCAIRSTKDDIWRTWLPKEELSCGWIVRFRIIKKDWDDICKEVNMILDPEIRKDANRKRFWFCKEGA